ncbi:MarR family winged helix-turn-helix transcriptional regulator [Curtobacterium sp. MCBA15_004]|uniref:MarR family winged helix-turn-helix transcriptional regulator n=1 Tax=Curtobacterium sp. MCBA15_004 TaxID=1898733 RepID=UPI002735CC89|nr:MarR family winged helix-turn-helix transcriptional regulator [Curtobacterium sp. MCBA15_004]WIA96906.1 MarR family winged helix-turn-helix transcriptional regulator [Curtobacterium sp. MCBA15_004]
MSTARLVDTLIGMSTEGSGGHDWATWDAYHDAWRRLDRALDHAVQEGAGISVPEFEILIGLHRAPDHKLRVRDISSGIGWEKSRVSHQVTRMVARGLVVRADCPHDGRGSWVEMTPDGRRAVLAGIRAHTEALGELFWRPVGTDADTLRSVSARLEDAIGPDEHEAVAG